MSETFLSTAEESRATIIRDLSRKARAANGQFLTPQPIAKFMAELFRPPRGPMRLLDPGAGAGALAFAFIDRLVDDGIEGSTADVVAVESDALLASRLQGSAQTAFLASPSVAPRVSFSVIQGDFIEYAIAQLMPPLRAPQPPLGTFTHAILNPPYFKLPASSGHRSLLAKAGIDAPNMYAAFVALSLALLCEGGELVAITPRSFCNGPYFRRFRHQLLRDAVFERIHVFGSRKSAFQEDQVLQENVIFRLRRSVDRRPVHLSASSDRGFTGVTDRVIPYENLVSPLDPALVIRIPTNDFDAHVLERLSCFPHRLKDLQLAVSTGPVVDFRLADSIEETFSPGSAALVYPSHVEHNTSIWPRQKGHKPSSIRVNDSTLKWLLPNGHYVLIRRFSSKEEKRRIYPALFGPLGPHITLVGFENHLNVIHHQSSGVEPNLAKGLVAYFASTIVDQFFRQFSGHTQVNATDIRAIPVPPTDVLQSLSTLFQGGSVRTPHVDEALEDVFRSRYLITSPDPTKQP